MADDRCDELDFSARIRFPDVIADEYAEIHNRRRAANGGAVGNGRPERLLGLALSGGGVRSATFNLGLLQALAETGKLKLFDYLSTVSGGGYVGGWWSAFLARDARDKDKLIFPEPEDIESERDDRRAKLEDKDARADVERPQIKDSAINAAEDPIHHLRLFSNVMTPRKGLLSADTWRAIAVISRNIVMTWVILVPILLAAIMIGQAWFTLNSDWALTLKGRLLLALAVPGLLFIGSVVCAIFWMLFSRRWQSLGDKIVVVVSTLVFFALTGIAIKIFGLNIPEIFCLVLIFWTAYVAGRLLWFRQESGAKRHDSDFWRNRLTYLQTKTLSYAVFSLVIFLFAGFGHIIFNFLLREGESKVTQAGGWGAIGLSVLSWVYTALKASPTGGGDNKPSDKPSLLQKIVVAVAPATLLLVLGIVLSWIGNAAYLYVHKNPDVLVVVARGALVSAALFLVLALYEFRPPQKWKSVVVVIVWFVVLIGAYWLKPGTIPLVNLGAVTLLLLAAALIFRAFLRKKIWIAFYAGALFILAIWIFFYVDRSTYILDDRKLPIYVLAGVIATLVLLLFELVQGRGANTRAITLTVIACTIFVLIGAAAGSGANFGDRAVAMVGLIAIVLGWVLALGWLADPNALTMHGFYKARLVRAYMGASNERRAAATEADITDAVPGDDLLLTQLKNTDRGAPYHLINTMLNLVGGSDLSTQARASDSFLMSKLYCGSTRTGYRKTKEYACGTLSLGTAVAVSGAAAAPSMGAQSPSAALSALMTLFNIRLGYWAPTPSLSYWRSGAARLWPVYTLQELASQTTDLLPYCYLTDGGHYENTGVYSLIQRGCNLIVVGECGADPQSTLDDLGNMIRKVRIDFDTEVVFKDEYIDKLRAHPPGAHVIVGEIRYGDDHAAALGLSEDEKVGTIVVVKPNLAGGEPVDVKQYGYLHGDFPQQFTFDLWYDEAQFESYRRLGEESGKLAATFI